MLSKVDISYSYKLNCDIDVVMKYNVEKCSINQRHRTIEIQTFFDNKSFQIDEMNYFHLCVMSFTKFVIKIDIDRNEKIDNFRRINYEIDFRRDIEYDFCPKLMKNFHKLNKVLF